VQRVPQQWNRLGGRAIGRREAPESRHLGVWPAGDLILTDASESNPDLCVGRLKILAIV
jgi:hypothetical protein